MVMELTSAAPVYGAFFCACPGGRDYNIPTGPHEGICRIWHALEHA